MCYIEEFPSLAWKTPFVSTKILRIWSVCGGSIWHPHTDPSLWTVIALWGWGGHLGDTRHCLAYKHIFHKHMTSKYQIRIQLDKCSPESMDICIRKEKVIVYHPFLFFLKSWIPVWKVVRHLCISKVLQPAGCPGTCFQICICICCSCSTSTLLLSFQSYVLESSHYFQSFLNFPRMYWRQMYIKIFLLPSLNMFSSLTI